MVDLKNLKDLEWYFAEHFDTILFSMLAERYLISGDLERAQKVCEIGLQYHPDNVSGLFIQGRTYMAGEKYTKAEKVFKRAIDLDPGHLNAHLMLAEVQKKLDRSKATLKKLYHRILKIDHTNEKVKEWLDNIEKGDDRENDKKLSEKKKVTPRDELSSLPISPQLATFTLVTILKSQKLYEQALEVLSLMSRKKGIDKKRINEERETLIRLMKGREKI